MQENIVQIWIKMKSRQHGAYFLSTIDTIVTAR